MSQPDVVEKIKDAQSKQSEFNFLKSQQLISGLSSDKIQELISKITTKTKQADEIVFEEGSVADSLIFVKKGQVRLTKPSAGERLLGVRREADLFGEMALLSDEPRTERATAGQGGCILFQLTVEDFKTVVGDDDRVEEKLAEYAQQQLLQRQVMLSAPKDSKDGKTGHDSHKLLKRGNIKEGWLFGASLPVDTC